MNITNIQLESKCDHLKGNWFEWFCTAEIEGKTVFGTIQADGYGEMIAEETFELGPLEE